MIVKMIPGPETVGSGAGGIAQVIANYAKHLPAFGVDVVGKNAETFDLVAAHAGATGKDCDVSHCHGLYWTADYNAGQNEWATNTLVIDSVRNARAVTVPSAWVAEAFQRDMHFTPHIIPHGIDYQEWSNEGDGGYILWNKNRKGDVCHPDAVYELAKRFRDEKFATTFGHNVDAENVQVIGKQPHHEMKQTIQRCKIYLSSTKETFGIGVLEAMASGKPVLGWNVGGNVDLIEHGVNGYLAEYMNYDDLGYGLSFCLQNSGVLGANSLELVKKWTWENACKMVADVYEKALKPEKPTITVVIPVFNYATLLERAVASVLEQTIKPKVIIVNDGSHDNSLEVAQELAKKHKNIKVIDQKNSGVAIARNSGIAATNTKYICCLDADDRIEPEFLETCINALEDDNSLGIAYTSLLALTPDGRRQPSVWPEDFNAEKHFSGQNQIPTCNVFRREAWQRVGGYRQRYAPTGAGSEDADFWTRILSVGYGAKRVSENPLFEYSLYTGNTSKREYVYVDWMSDKQNLKEIIPFASPLKPKNGISHPARQYDQPHVSIIIPVGPGHHELVKRGLDSIEAQNYHKWEVIAVNDTGKPLELDGYPYVRIVDTPGKKGAGYARNRGAEIARGKFLYFLDADDHLMPNCIKESLIEWNRSQSIVYSDYIFKAVMDEEEADKLRRSGLLLDYSKQTSQAICKHNWIDYSCEKFRSDIRNNKFYHWCLVNCLVPKAWHDEIGGFDESMQSWEDVDYHWRMAWNGKCFSRVAEPLVVYRFDTGQRRSLANAETDTAKKNALKLIKYMVEKLERTDKNMPCPRGCGGTRKTSSTYFQKTTPAQSTNVATSLDGQSVKVEYIMDMLGRANRASHEVTGTTIFREKIDGVKMKKRQGGFVMFYGWMGVGQQLRILRSDYEQTPKRWRLIEDNPAPVEAPKIERESPKAPELIGAPIEEKPPVNQDDLSLVPGVGGKLKTALENDGHTTIADLKKLSLEQWKEYDGVGVRKAAIIMEWLEDK